MTERARDPSNQWLYTTPATPEELAQLRKSNVEFYRKAGLEIAGFTCDTCSMAPRCTLAFDAYNTNGDCLYDK